MIVKTNKIYFSIINILLLFCKASISPTCEIELTCKRRCTDPNLKNGVNGDDKGTYPLTNLPPFSSSFNQYDDRTFNCEPGDKIIFNNNADDYYNGGFIGKLTIKGSDGTQLTYTSYDLTIFTCSPTCRLSTDKQLKFGSDPNDYFTLEYPSFNSVDVTIKKLFILMNL